MSKRILHIVTNVSRYKDVDQQTGLWLGELTHAYDEFEKQGYIQDIVSPNGGKTPIEPKSLVPLVADNLLKTEKKIKLLLRCWQILLSLPTLIGKTMT